MKILLSSHFFHPSVGGIEEVSRVLAEEFVALGHEVKVVTQTAAGESRSGILPRIQGCASKAAGSRFYDRKTAEREAVPEGVKFPFEIARRPGPLRLLRLVNWCDVFFHNNISLRAAWPLLISPRPWVVAHHTWIARMDGSVGWQDRLKQFVARRAKNICISRAVSAHISAPSTIIGNPYRDSIFRADSNAKRDIEIAFLGRLVRDKGVDLLLWALVELRKGGLTPRATIIGDGSEVAALRQYCSEMQLDAQVTFVGSITGSELVALLNRHRLLVIPSRWQEPSGLVALEGIACGCVPVAARCGGLPDAVGDCGVTFERENIDAMAHALAELLAPGGNLTPFRLAAAGHLDRHKARAVTLEYLRVFEGAAAQ